MCDYCDCRQLDPIADLSAEHDQLLALSARVRAELAAGRLDEASTLLDELLAVLERHAHREEGGLFAALAADEDLRGVVGVLLAEHAILHIPPERSAAGITAFLGELAAHIDREEHDVFPAVLQLLPPSAWNAILGSAA
jgi:hemerythrin-like domain-containing protein